MPDLAEFYANCVVTNGVVTSTVNGRDLSSKAKELGEILGVPAEGFGVMCVKIRVCSGQSGCCN